MNPRLIQPAIEGHIPGIPGQLLHQAGGRQHRQGRHGPPGRIGAQAVVPAATGAQADPLAIKAEGGHQQQPQRPWEQGRPQGRWDAAKIGLQGLARLPGPVGQGCLAGDARHRR